MKSKLNTTDKFICELDRAIRINIGLLSTFKPGPVKTYKNIKLTSEDRKTSARLMRINHTGEICAQALYQGQAISTKSPEISQMMKRAAEEETDHLIWCEVRLRELESRVSYLNPIFYLGSFLIGTLAGTLGDKINLGLVAATEDGVVKHLQDHLEKLPEKDDRSREILLRMKEDEKQHADKAIAAGAQQYPTLVKGLMNWASKIMTRTTYWI
ncbi:MAG: 2-polyprenyl-3-methyl-6-methoxy-1,4-benzoquinone monooxygenase [Candidatus Azotimanducaceae bacterium]|uniref:3-demethoxyubiquinol 3-hydroxylase n=1 Tax=OM182 bacterium TaxID=2510334 RepID=A0A520S3L7_9GAMM|nr:demethoxyubiquinone hydroxylase family protein [Gammaproteobacteria bacterium]OUV67587.1 MAG: hypothetical protein CBC93_04775 [Gammaproteobacteria bacterium TMED133]RZO77051.1 MAG: 2-polyprenyl-3-methyl-6-methoxy-1,4-benzoquinone monooxygenase [OM182 bacterium]